jgi:hypothetical protein
MAVQKHDWAGVRVTIVGRGHMADEALTGFIIGASVDGKLPLGKPSEIEDNIAVKSFS